MWIGETRILGAREAKDYEAAIAEFSAYGIAGAWGSWVARRRDNGRIGVRNHIRKNKFNDKKATVRWRYFSTIRKNLNRNIVRVSMEHVLHHINIGTGGNIFQQIGRHQAKAGGRPGNEDA